jgi:hyperosmotically inducible protein
MNDKKLFSLLAVIAGLALSPGFVRADVHAVLPDREIQTLVEHVLAEKDILNLRVTVQNGVVTLAGVVPSLWAKEKAIELAGKVHDAQSVVSQLSIAPGASDTEIAEQIGQRVRQYVFYTIYDDVNVAVRNGRVQLTGRVTEPYKAKEIANLAGRVPGVLEVRNDIQTLPASPFDDQLRTFIASQIYRDPLFWGYSLQVNPPLHIIVDNGRVTLTGVVSSEVEKREAEMIARSTFGVLSVENKLQVEK